MNRESPSAFLLFELLGRRWGTPAAALAVQFNASQTRAAAPLADGSVAIVDCADPEPPEARMRVDESGRRTIAARVADPRPLTIVAARGSGAAKICQGAEDGFLLAYEDGSLWRLHPEGAAAELLPKGQPRVVDIARCATGATLIATAESIELRSDSGATATSATPQGLCAAALSPDGKTLVYGLTDGLALVSATAPGEVGRRFETPAPVERIFWRRDSDFLAATCADGKLALLSLADNRFGLLGGFPAQPRSVAWNGPSNALVASGAYRIAAWDLSRPPFDGDQSGALETGRAGMVAVEQVAAHPDRKLVAAAYANGQIVLAEPGRRDELVLRASGPAPSALAFSPDGKMLGVASPDSVALVSLPASLFK